MPRRPNRLDPHRTLAQGPASGIFGPDWPKWRGAIMEVALEGEPPFLARLDDVRRSGAIGNFSQATLMELDHQLQPVGPRTLPWPPPGSVRVIRTP